MALNLKFMMEIKQQENIRQMQNSSGNQGKRISPFHSTGMLTVTAIAWTCFSIVLFGVHASAQLPDRLAQMFEDPLERWEPAAPAPEFSWAENLAGGSLETVVLVPRWSAFEVMELDRRLDMNVAHIFLESSGHFWDSRRWHYSNTTGKRPIAVGLHMRRAQAILSKDETDLYLVAGIDSGSGAIPKELKQIIVNQVKAGKGLLIAGDMGYRKGWPEEMFANPDPDLARQVEEAFDSEEIPGFRAGEPGRGVSQAEHLAEVTYDDTRDLVHAYRYGKGRVVVVQYGLSRPYAAMHRESTKASLVPLTYAAEGVEGGTDRALGFMARAALIAADRKSEISVSAALAGVQGGEMGIEIKVSPSTGVDALYVRVEDSFDRTLYLGKTALASEGTRIALSRPPYGDLLYVDVIALNGAGEVLDFASRALKVPEGPRITEIQLGPVASAGQGITPMLDLSRGGELSVSTAWTGLNKDADTKIQWEVSDVTGRILARHESELVPGEKSIEARFRISTPVILSHKIEASLIQNGKEVATAMKRFTVPVVSSDEEDFWVVFWGSIGAEPVSRVKDRILYNEGADALMQARFTRLGLPGDESIIDREYSMLARSGLRALPYATRIHGRSNEDNHRIPSLFDKGQGRWYANELSRLSMVSEMGEPYSPLAINLGDENYLLRYGTQGGDGEVDYSPIALETFREWLSGQYEDIAQLNEAWGTRYGSFGEVEPLLLEQAIQQEKSFAEWLEHRRFMAESFTGVHDQFAAQIKESLPDALVGWEGFFGYGRDEFDWRLGYDYAGLTEHQRINVTYIGNWISSELTRSFARRDALSGKWGNQIANDEAGFGGHSWDVLLAGMNSVWWWHSWGTYYTPFYPNATLNDQGKWFFSAVKEIKAGPGKLLLGSERDHSGIGVLYAPNDMYVSTLVGQIASDSDAGGSKNYWEEQAALLRAIKDLGYQYRYVSLKDLESGSLPYPDYRLLFLSYPVAVSKEQAEALRVFVSSGGTLVVNGQAGLLSGTGLILDEAMLDKFLLGVRSTSGLKGLTMPSRKVELNLATTGEMGQTLLASVEPGIIEVSLLDTGLTATEGTALAYAEGVPVLVSNQVGDGTAILTNFSWRQTRPAAPELLDRRLNVRIDEPGRLDLLDAIIRSAGIEPPAEVWTTDYERPKAVEQVFFYDGEIGYLALQQDLLLLDLPPQKLQIALPADGIIYDVRRGELLSGDVIDAAEGSHVPFEYHEWEAEISRGNPLLYAILPYKVTGLQGSVTGEIKKGNDITVNVKVNTRGGAPQRHAVRMDVYAPGADGAHREYSQTISCPQGAGQAIIPFALNDSSGTWTLHFRDAATGTSEILEIQLP